MLSSKTPLPLRQVPATVPNAPVLFRGSFGCNSQRASLTPRGATAPLWPGWWFHRPVSCRAWLSAGALETSQPAKVDAPKGVVHSDPKTQGTHDARGRRASLPLPSTRRIPGTFRGEATVSSLTDLWTVCCAFPRRYECSGTRHPARGPRGWQEQTHRIHGCLHRLTRVPFTIAPEAARALAPLYGKGQRRAGGSSVMTSTWLRALCRAWLQAWALPLHTHTHTYTHTHTHTHTHTPVRDGCPPSVFSSAGVSPTSCTQHTHVCVYF